MLILFIHLSLFHSNLIYSKSPQPPPFKPPIIPDNHSSTLANPPPTLGVFNADRFDDYALSASEYNTCLVHPHNGRLVCSGSNAHGINNVPRQFRFQTIGVSVGQLHACAIKVNKTVRNSYNATCWGNNATGALDIDTGDI